MATNYNATGDTRSNTTGSIRSWAGHFEATLTAGGWTQTADTGQTAASALAAQTGANLVSGYQVWKMSDSLAGTYPCYMKVEYGSGTSGTGTAMGLWVTIGTGSDGAGTITGVLLSRTALHSGSANGGLASAPIWGSAGNARLAWFASGSGAATWILFSIERSKDATGADTGDGFMILNGNAGSSTALTVALCRYLRPSGNTLANSTAIGAFAPSGATWADSGALVGVCPLRYFNGQPSNPGLAWLVYFNGDTAQGVSVTCSIYGTTHTFMPLGTTYLNTVAGANANTSFMMQWE